ncbi:MAG TPA: DUF1385 domain-containing protein [Chloroflexota bacterium]|nr:DUF1385 domain-containing protein [Chloroflexota bacterium]
MARFYYGGQAVMEGVMMRGRRAVAVAVRAPSGEIVVHEEAVPRPFAAPLFRLPFLRGLLGLYDMLVLGTRMLLYSAEIAAGDPDGADAAVNTKALSIGTLAGALLGVAVFLLVPVLLTRPFDHAGAGPILSNVIEGVIRLAMFIVYISLIGRVPDIQRVFAYHGAEHKTINAFEAGDPLTVAGVRPHSLQHPRCGTGFLLVVAVLCIVVFAFLGRPPMLVRLASRVVLIPLVAAIAYELLRLGANGYHRPVVRALLRPSLALQRLTTREPDDQQIAVAIRAFATVKATDDAAAVLPGLLPAISAPT